MARELYLIIHDVRSAHNVGSLFRTADGAGVSKIFLTGYTPAPTDRFGRGDARIAKVSLGAEDSVPWEKHDDALALLERLKQNGVQIIALEQHPAARRYSGVRPVFPAALIVGNEVEGIPEKLLTAADIVMQIPMRGAKESLNVSNAAAVALYSLVSDF